MTARTMLVDVLEWQPSAFVDAWSFALLSCGHKVEHRRSTRPKRKPCSACWLARAKADLEQRRGGR
jgi:hypothetical protein